MKSGSHLLDRKRVSQISQKQLNLEKVIISAGNAWDEVTAKLIEGCCREGLGPAFEVTCWERADLFAVFVMFYGVFVTFPCGILGQMWYMILIPDLCLLSYFDVDS